MQSRVIETLSFVPVHSRHQYMIINTLQQLPHFVIELIFISSNKYEYLRNNESINRLSSYKSSSRRNSICKHYWSMMFRLPSTFENTTIGMSKSSITQCITHLYNSNNIHIHFDIPD